MEVSADPDVATILRSLAPEEVDMLRDAFIFMDRDSDGFVSMAEMMSKVQSCVGEDRFLPMIEYLEPLFLVADKDKDGRLSLTEFLLAFADGPGVVPAEVINSCVADVRVRLTDEEVSALQENYRRMDVNGDGMVDPMELEAALRQHLLPKFPDLTDENFKEIVTVVMASADADRDGALSLSEFIRSYQEDQGVLPAAFLETTLEAERSSRDLTAEETALLREAFAVLDKNGDGFLDIEDLYSALWDTLASNGEDEAQIRDLCDLIMITADRNMLGRLSMTDFIRSFLLNVQLMQIPVAVAQERVRIACKKLQEMHDSGELEKLVMVFEDLDSNGDGYVDRQEMVSVLKTLFRDAFPGWDDDMLTSVLTAIVVGAETDHGGQLSLEEFIRSFVEGPGILPPSAVQSWEATSAPDPRPHRLSTATDEDLHRIGEALRRLHDRVDEDGCISLEELHASILLNYPDSPTHGEDMYEYALQQFVRCHDDGRFEWNENVKFDDGVEGDDDGSGVVVSDAPTAPPQGVKHPPQQPPVEQVVSRSPAVNAEDEDEDEPSVVMHTSPEVVPPLAVAKEGARMQPSPLPMPNMNGGRQSPSTNGAVEEKPAADEYRVEGKGAAAAASQRTPSRSGSGTPFQAVQTMPKQMVLASQRVPATHDLVVKKPLFDDSSYASRTSAIFDDELQQLFEMYDIHNRGYLDREEFKKEYLSMEQYGLEPSQAEVNLRFRQYSRGSDKINYNEFCILMLQRLRM